MTAKVEIRPRYFTLTVTGVSGGELDWLQLCNLRVKMNENVGALVNAAWDGQFAACVLACNDRTDCGSHGVPTARAYREFGIEGAKVAIVGVPTGGPEPSSKLLDAIEVVELEQGLPHPTINGVWIKRAPERFASYLMVSGVNQQNIDQVIEFARGGFGCVEIFWERSTPTYEPNPSPVSRRPGGTEDGGRQGPRRRTATRPARDAGDGRLGRQGRSLHHAQGRSAPAPGPPRDAGRCAGREEHRDPRPRSRPPIGRRRAICTSRARSSATRSGPPTALPSASAGCTRPPSSRIPRGLRLGHLVNCFPIWGHTVYCPDVKSTMIDEICDRIARVFNEVGADMSYFDGGEEIAVQPPHWRNQGRIALGVQSRLRKPVILEGNALYTHLSWHVISRGSPSYDPIYFGRRAYTLRFKGQNPAGWANNLLTGDVGWFAPHAHSPATDAVTPDEVELLCLKALGGKVAHLLQRRRQQPLGQQADAGDAGDHPHLRRAETPQLLHRGGLRGTPPADGRARAGAGGGRRLGPAAAAVRPARAWSTPPGPNCASGPTRTRTQQQSPWIRLRARTALVPHGAKGNLVLADPAAGVPFQPAGSAAANVGRRASSPRPRSRPTGAACSAIGPRIEPRRRRPGARRR